MLKTVLNVATGRFVKGQDRLKTALTVHAPDAGFICWKDSMPPNCPSHQDVPYAFKAHAIASCAGAHLVLWADASILPVRSLDPLWDMIQKQGYWFSDNGWSNGQWCSDTALPLFGMTREEAFTQKHVVATAFGLNLKSDIGRDFIKQYLKFALNGALCGPWTNKSGEASSDPRVLGHRHDQTAASVIAHRLGMKLTAPPAWFAYAGSETEETVLVADGAY